MSFSDTKQPVACVVVIRKQEPAYPMSVLGIREIATRMALALVDRIMAASHRIGSNNVWYVYLRLQIATVAEEAPSVWYESV
jgi:hypothetical protein